MMGKLYIRADGSMDIGMGHLIRCIALAQIVSNDFTVHFVCKEIPPQTKAELIANEFELTLIDEEDNFFALLNKKDIAVLDGYHYDFAYQQKIKATGASVACIDDIHDKPFAADLIINHAPGISENYYVAQPYTKFLLGTEYALLRTSFLNQAKKKMQSFKNESVLICFGGADGKNLTATALEAVLAFDKFKKINVITGPAYHFLESLQHFMQSNRAIVHYHAVSEQQMLELMIASDVVIVPASGILYEALCTGSIIISGTYVNNQQFIYKALKKAGAFISAGNFSKEEIIDALNKLDTTTLNNTSIIDGLSPKRILSALYDVKLTVRNATGNDSRLLFNWANDVDVRNNAINKKAIEWNGHVKWLAAKLESEQTKIFILEYNNEPVGQVRYDYNGTDCLIDYSIDMKYRGKGFGKLAIEKTIHHFTGTEITAMVLENNTASSATFEKLNFKLAGNKEIDGQNFLIYKILL